MAVDYYFGKTIPELETLLARAQQQLVDGRTSELTIGGNNGMRTRRDVHEKHDPEKQIFQLRYSLWLRSQQVGTDAQKAKYTNPQKERITRTKPNYSGWANS